MLFPKAFPQKSSHQEGWRHCILYSRTGRGVLAKAIAPLAAAGQPLSCPCERPLYSLTSKGCI